MDVTARFAGAIVSFVLVSVILLQTSVTLGLVVLLGVPLLLLLIGPLLSPLQRRSAHQRDSWASSQHRDRHRQRPARAARHRRRAGLPRPLPPRVADTRRAGVEVGRLQSVLDALQVLLPGLFVVIVVWLGRALAVAGTITAGRAGRVLRLLGVPVIPLRTATEYANKLIRARVAAAPHLHRARGPARLHRPGAPGRRRRPWAPTSPTPAPGCGSSRAG